MNQKYVIPAPARDDWIVREHVYECYASLQISIKSFQQSRIFVLIYAKTIEVKNGSDLVNRLLGIFMGSFRTTQNNIVSADVLHKFDYHVKRRI